MKISDVSRNSDDLFEVSMSPTNLKKMAAQTGARVGFEFEVYVPEKSVDDYYDYDDQIPDMSNDGGIRYISDIQDFYDDRDYNDSETVDEIIAEIIDGYKEWFDKKMWEEWTNEKQLEFIEKLVNEEHSPSEIIEFALTSKLIPNNYYSTETILKIVDAGTGRLQDKKYAKKYQELESDIDYITRLYCEYLLEKGEEYSSFPNDAKDAYQDSYRDDNYDDFQSDFLEEELGIKKLSDMLEKYPDLRWTRYKDLESEDIFYKLMADEVSGIFGKEAKGSSSYHGAPQGNWYRVESDGSLSLTDGYQGVEIISPTPPPFLEQSIEDFLKFYEHAQENDYRTDKRTGLHMSISVPNYSMENLDVIKLILFMGDRLVLEKFKRINNTYTKGVFSKLEGQVKTISPSQISKVFSDIKQGIFDNTKKNLEFILTEKHFSVNIEYNRVEFRGPGNDWLNNQSAEEIINTVYRFAVALDIACDPEKYREEYAKKLYKLLARNVQDDTIKVFSLYNSGAIPTTVLKNYLKSKDYDINRVDIGKYYLVVDEPTRSTEDWKYAESLTDAVWSLPTVSELKGIYSQTKKNQNLRTEFYWTSNLNAEQDHAWALNMYSGRLELKPVTEHHRVVLVKRLPKK